MFSRQRYWGEPIPLVHCPNDGVVPVPEAQLPVRLPDVERYEPTGTGESPLAAIESFVNTTCPKCGGPAKRETNTMPQWAGSCWYYLRYLDPKNDARAFDPAIEKQWMAVDLYVGGAEHSVLHLLYARFWHKVLYDIGAVSTKEPFQKLRHQGTVLAYSYEDAMGRYHELGEVELRGDEVFLKATGEKLKVTVEKMAKSKMNGVNPDDVIRDYGADVLRLYEMFMGEFELPKPWDPRAIEGVNRFIKRVWRLVEEWDAAKAPADDPHLRLRHKTIKRVTARSRTHAVQHRDRGADGVPERARRGRRQPRDARRSGRDASPRRAVRARTWPTRGGRTWAARASCSSRPGRRSTPR